MNRCAFALALASSAMPAQAALVAYEGFDYAAGGVVGTNGGSGFSGAEQVTDSLAAAAGGRCRGGVVMAVIVQVAPLAPRAQVRRVAILRRVIEVADGQDDADHLHRIAELELGVRPPLADFLASGVARQQPQFTP